MVQWSLALVVRAVTTRRALGLVSKPLSPVLGAGIALILGLPVGQGTAAISRVLCLTTSPSRHPGQRGQAGDGVYPRWLIHGGHGEHDRWQCPGQLRERDCHHPELPRWSAWYGLASVGTAGQWDEHPQLMGAEPDGKGVVGGMGPNRLQAALWQAGVQWGLAPGTGPLQAHLHNLAQLKANIGLQLNK